MKRVYAATALATLLCPGPLLAAEAPIAGNGHYMMDEVVVTATKTDEQRWNISNPVIIMNREDIDAAPADNIGQLLANEAGIDLRSLGNYGGAAQEIHMRGMGGSATQVLINGVRLNSPSLGLADLGKVVYNAVERIEVVKGAGSLLYGSGAMAGTVSMETKRPDRDEATNKISAGFGTENTYRLAAEHGMFTDGDFGYYLTGSYIDTDGFRDNSDMEKADVSINMVLDKSDQFDLSLYGDYVTRKYGVPGVVPPAGTQVHAIDGVVFVNNESDHLLDRGEDEDSHLVLRAKANPLPWLGITLDTDFTSMENLHHGRYASSGTGLETITTNEIFGAAFLLDFHADNLGTLLFGVEYDNFDWDNDQVSLDGLGGPVTGSQTSISNSLHTVGTFTEIQFQPNDYFKLLAGVRHEDHSTFGKEVLPMVGLVIHPCDTTTVKFSHGKHFLAPTMNDLFYPADAWVAGNPNLQPENGHHTDVTVEQSVLGDRLFMTASYFKWTINDKILWDLNESWLYTPQNLNSFESDGLELGVEIGPFANMRGGLAYTYTNADETNVSVTRAATYVAKDKFKARLTFWTDFGLTGTVVGNYIGSRPYFGSDKTATSPVAELDSYWTADIKLEQQLAQKLLLSLQVLNIFDEEYNTAFGSFFDPADFFAPAALGTYPGAGTSVFASLTYKY